MTGPLHRRRFLGTSGAAIGATFAAKTGWARGQDAPSNRVTIGVMGQSRGKALATGFAKQPGVTVKYCCDVDSKRAADGADAVRAAGDQSPEPIQDFRRILDDPEVDALVCAAPNHWHGPATILGCAAGKHVYVEKPACHNPHEGELMVEAARKHKRAVQLGTQRRSSPQLIEAMAMLHDGLIGRVYHARSFYESSRGSIGHADPSQPPEYIDYELWQGPAPRQPFKSNVVHYNWHWFWHWGNGELGNNGVHALDLVRWGLDADYPTRVTSTGGRYVFPDDDQQTPDTHTVSFEFPGNVSADWQGLSCNRSIPTPFVVFYGTEGALSFGWNGELTATDPDGKVIREIPRPRLGEPEHLANFLAAIRNDATLDLNAEIEKGVKSTLLCHLGNIAQRVDRVLHVDEKTGRIVGDDEAMGLWSREYADGWAPKV